MCGVYVCHLFWVGLCRVKPDPHQAGLCWWRRLLQLRDWFMRACVRVCTCVCVCMCVCGCVCVCVCLCDLFSARAASLGWQRNLLLFRDSFSSVLHVMSWPLRDTYSSFSRRWDSIYILCDTAHMYLYTYTLHIYGREEDVYICVYIHYETRRTCIYTYVLYAYMGERKTCIYVCIYVMRHGAHVYTHMYFMHTWERGRRSVGSIKLHVSFAEYRLFCGALLQIHYTYMGEGKTSWHVPPVPEKMRLEMVIGIQNKIQIGIKKLSLWVSFHIFKWK